MHIVFLLLALLSCGIVTGDDWKYRGPGELNVLSIVPDRSNPRIVFTIINNDRYNHRGALYRSVDYGVQWQPTSLKNGVTQVLVHPESSAVLAVAAAPNFSKVRLWISRDRGKTFHPRGQLSGNTRMIWHSTQEKTLYRVISTQAQRSTDLGLTWHSLTNFPKQVGGCSVRYWEDFDFLYFKGNLYAVAEATRPNCSTGSLVSFVLQSIDGGTRWKIISAMPETREQRREYDNFRFHWDPTFPRRAILHGVSGIVSFNPPHVNAISNPYLHHIVSVPGYPTKLYAVGGEANYLSNGLLWESNDQGVTWKQLDDTLNHSVQLLQTVEGPTETVLAGTRVGIYYRSTGPEWRAANGGLIKAHSQYVTSVSKSGNRIYALNFDHFLFRRESLDSGWKNLSFQYRLAASERIVLMRANARNKDHVLLLTMDYTRFSMLISKDGGFSWTRSAVGDPSKLQFTFDPGNPNVLYLLKNGSLLKSTDGGLTAEKLPLNFAIDSLAISPFDSRIFYFLTQGKLYRSSDGGQTAQPVGNRFFSIVGFLPEPNSLLAAEVLGQVYRSTDGGEHWRKIGRADVDPEDVCGHPYECAPKALYATDATHYFSLSISQIFFESNDAGRTWIPVNRSVYDVTDPSNPPIFIATPSGAYQKIKK